METYNSSNPNKKKTNKKKKPKINISSPVNLEIKKIFRNNENLNDLQTLLSIYDKAVLEIWDLMTYIYIWQFKKSLP